MTKYNSGLLQLQISEQLNIFKDRVTIITNAIQQLHHCKLAVDLLSPYKMEIIHTTLTKIEQDEDFHNQQKNYTIIIRLK
jgi:hypothetical protein